MTGQPLNTGRPRWWVAGVSVALLLVVGLLTWQLTRSDDYVANPRKVDAPVAKSDAAGRVLRALEESIEARDREAAAALAAPDDPASAELLGAVLDNAEDLHVEDFTLRYVDEAGGVDREGRWQAAVDMTWRFDGFDEVPVREEVLVGFDADGEHVSITGFGGGDRRSPVWLSGPLEVRRSPTSLVLVAGPDGTDTASSAASYARLAARAVPVVRRVLPDSPGRLVLEVPASAADLDLALAADPGTYANIAAVSASVDGIITPESPVHVFVNPTLFESLKPIGAQVVISHEATHVATDAPVTTGVPLWLLEGFADYVALRDVDLPITTTAGQIIEQVQRDGPPDALPGTTEFDESSTHLGASYESAWIACTLLAEPRDDQRGDEESLVRLHQRIQGGAAVDQALQDLFGITEAELTELWQDRLVDLSERSTGAA